MATGFLVPLLYPMVEVSSNFLSAAVQLVVSGGFAALVVQLLLVRQNRRKIEGEASGAEANAASVLSGAALQMVKSAQASAAAAQKEAKEAKEEQARLWAELNKAQWKSYSQEVRIRVLQSALTQAKIDVPEAPEPEFPPPPFPHQPPVSD